jgi:hypothetical protein
MLINWARTHTGKRHDPGGAPKKYEYNDYQHRFYRSAKLSYYVYVKDQRLHIPAANNMVPATLQDTSKIIGYAIKTDEVWHPKMSLEEAWSMNERVLANRIAWFKGKHNMAAKELIKTIRFMIRDKETPLDPVVADRLTLALLVDLSENYAEDHEKVKKMWTVYNINVWVLSALGTLFVGLAFALMTGQVDIVKAAGP